MSNNKKQNIILTIIAIVVLLLAVVGATYAFFASQNTGKQDVNINAESGTTDVLTFESGADIDIIANLSNFASGMSSISQTTNPKATLRANDATNTAEEEYNVYLVIDENGLIYTDKENKTPELLLEVTGPDGKIIEDIPGLNHYENVDGQEGVSGFDITNKQKAFTIYEGYKIVVGEEDEGVKVDTWGVKVTLVNFKTSNQNDNTGRTFHGRIVMTKGTEEDAYKLAHINTVSTKQTTDSITATLDITDGTKAISEYWFGIENKGEVMTASLDEFNDYHQSETGATYTFNELDDNTNYVIYSYVVDEEGFKSNVYTTEIVATEKYVLPKILTATATATNYDTIEVKVTSTEDGSNPISNYRYQIETNNGIIADKTITKKETTHTFTGLTELTQYKIIINAIDSNNKESTNYEIDVTTLNKTIGTICQSQDLDQCLINNYQQDSALIYHNTVALTSSNIANEELNANDNSYRYSGSSEKVKNYVCLDGTSKDGTCQNGDADLYRIIGFFPNESSEYEMKLIKYDYASPTQLGDATPENGGAYYDNNVPTSYYKGSNNAIGRYFYSYGGEGSFNNGTGSFNNMWKNSALNKVHLNQYYLNTYLSKVGGLVENITTHTWEVGGFDGNDFLVNEIYNKELGTEKITANDKLCRDEDYHTGARLCNQENDLEYPAKIGLMYVSDYGYAAYPEAWNVSMYKGGDNPDEIRKNNWLFMGMHEWCINRDSSASARAIYHNNYYTFTAWASSANQVRPCFYLTSNIKIVSGDGTKANPYRLSWN